MNQQVRSETTKTQTQRRRYRHRHRHTHAQTAPHTDTYTQTKAKTNTHTTFRHIPSLVPYLHHTETPSDDSVSPIESFSAIYSFVHCCNKKWSEVPHDIELIHHKFALRFINLWTGWHSATTTWSYKSGICIETNSLKLSSPATYQIGNNILQSIMPVIVESSHM